MFIPFDEHVRTSKKKKSIIFLQTESPSLHAIVTQPIDVEKLCSIEKVRFQTSLR